MNNEAATRVCTNCKYFQRYYVIASGFRFKPTIKGFCSDHKVNANISKRLVRTNVGCDLWQSEELQKLGHRYNMEITLNKAVETLEEIRDYLKDGEQ